LCKAKAVLSKANIVLKDLSIPLRFNRDEKSKDVGFEIMLLFDNSRIYIFLYLISMI